MGNCLVSPTRESGYARTRPNRRSYPSDAGRSRDILECSQPNSTYTDKQNSLY